MPNLLEALDKTDWQTFRFDEIAQNISKRVEPGATDLTVYVGLEHIDSGSLHIKRTGSPADVDGTKLLVYKGDVIFGRRRAYQRKAAVATFDGICSAHALVLRANPGVIEPRLFPFFLHSDAFMHRAIDISVGGLSPTINWGNLKLEEFQLPPRDQQAQLAELLWAADEVEGSYKEIHQKIDETQAALVEKEIYRSTVGKQPLAKVVVDIVAGTSLNGNNAEYIAPDEYAVLKVSAVGAKGFVPSESKVLARQEEFLHKYAVNAGDLLITRANGSMELVGRVCLVEEDYPNLMLCDKTLRIDVDEKRVSKRFLATILKGRDARKQIEEIATGGGGAMKNLTQAGIKSIQVPLPPMSEQVLQVRRLEILQAQTREAEILTAHASTVKQALINQIFAA